MRALTISAILLTILGCNRIDRQALVTRHNIEITQADPLNPLSVGNGEFAYTADITGMQTFPEFYEKGIGLGTMSQWGWHSFPNINGYKASDLIRKFKVGNSTVPYLYEFKASEDEKKQEASLWLRQNPQRLHLGLIGLEIMKNDSQQITIDDVQNPKQQLNLWTGELKSQFEVNGVPVKVITYCHQQEDMVSFKVESELIKQGKLKVKIRYPYVSLEKFAPGYDLSSPEKHQTSVVEENKTGALIRHQIDTTVYFTAVNWQGLVSFQNESNHTYTFTPAGKDNVEISFLFSPKIKEETLPEFDDVAHNNHKSWEKFWHSGAAADFSECTDPRARELERRVILSQYLTKIQCTGSQPPQETGLTQNSWYGKFHMEMIWWHAVHFIQWGRADLIEKELQFYFNGFEKAKTTAKDQGYKGARWQKMTDPSATESPSRIGTLLIWQQPHLIYFTDMLYRYYHDDKAILRKYHELEEATADFMASYARKDLQKKKYVLGPALIPAQECFDPATTLNPAFELVYWKWALQTAQNHRKALGLQPNEKWQDVIDNLSPLPIQDNRYLFSENATDSYTNSRYLTDHPIVLGVEGFFPKTDMVDPDILQNTFDTVLEKWDWDTSWGWDFPLAALCATMLNKPDKAIDLLLMDTPKNKYLTNGHNYQRESLQLYLPGNGALLTAVAFMCTYRDADGKDGFPHDGKWKVKQENFFPLHE